VEKKMDEEEEWMRLLRAMGRKAEETLLLAGLPAGHVLTGEDEVVCTCPLCRYTERRWCRTEILAEEKI
jgi:hypothetical protein